MHDEYEIAAIRHYKDALTLKEEERLDNAGHLIGFSAECAVKFKLNGSVHDHLPKLLRTARKYLESRSPMLRLLSSNAFNQWDVNRRYRCDGNTTSTELNAWITETRKFLNSANIKIK